MYIVGTAAGTLDLTLWDLILWHLINFTKAT